MYSMCLYVFLCMCFLKTGLNPGVGHDIPIRSTFLSNPYHMFGLIPSCSNDIPIKWLVSHV